jgi:predicted ferric reductase
MTDRIFHRASIVYLHRIFSLSLLVFSALHIVGLLLDRYIKMDLAQMLIPFDTSYRPLWTGIGTLSLYGAVAVVVSFYLSGKLGYKLWRATHYLSFLVFAGGFMHGLMAGTDSKSSWMLTIYLITGFIVVFLTGTRFFVRTGVMHEISGG